MAKKLFAIVMAAILAVSMFTFPAFADSSVQLGKDETNNKISVTWDKVADAASYEVIIFLDGNRVATATVSASSTLKYEYTYGSTGGNFTAQVIPKKSNGSVMSPMDSTTLNIPVESKGSNMTVTNDGTVNLTWTAQSGVSSYVIEYTLNNGSVGQVTASTNSCTLSGVKYSDLRSIAIYIGTSSSHQSASFASWGAPTTPGGTGTTTTASPSGNVSYANVSGSTISLTWAPVGGATQYRVGAGNDLNNYSGYSWSSATTALSGSVNFGSNKYVIVQAYRNGNWENVGGVILSNTTIGNTGNSGNLSVYVYGNNANISWNYYPNATKYRFAYSTNGTQPTNWQETGASIYASVPVYANYYTYVTVQAYVNGQWVNVGTRVINSNGVVNNNYGGNGSIAVSGRTYNSVTLTWAAVSGATYYTVDYKSLNGTTTNSVGSYTNSITLNGIGQNETFTVTIRAYATAAPVTVGTATVTPNGVTQNGTTTNGSTTVNGTNCTVTINGTNAVIRWNGNGSSRYTVNYVVAGGSGTAQQFTTSSTSATIQVSAGYSYNVWIVDANNSYVASAEVTAKASAPAADTANIKKTETKNLTVSAVNSYTTKISWNRSPDAEVYVVSYQSLDGAISGEEPTALLNFDIPFGSNKAYTVTVFGINKNTGTFFRIGYHNNVPGSSTVDNTLKDYPSELKAVSASKKVTLSWTAAKDATSYTIYYRRAGSTTWNKAGSVTKKAVALNGLTNDTEYEFKVVPNKGTESSIIKIAPSTTSKTVTVADPKGSTTTSDGDITIDDDNTQLVITSVTSASAGKITATWTNVGAASYRVYLAEGSSSSYKYCGTVNGTTVTLSKIGSGSSATNLVSGRTYKIRVVRSDYSGDLTTALKACKQINVTVK